MAMSEVIEHDRGEAGQGEAIPAEQRQLRPKGGRARAWRGVGIVVAAVLVGGAVGWAGATVFAPPDEALEADAFSTVPVVRGEVGSSITLNTVASWSTSPIALNGATGTVTSVDIEPGTVVGAGQQLYSVNLRPVVAGQGAIPSFGAIEPGDSGAQVTQLQQLLTDLGHWRGGTSGRYTAGFGAAVRDWQRATGFPADGVVQAGDIVWVPRLPARMTLDIEAIAVGRIVDAGTGHIVALGDAPVFRLPMQQAQTRLAPTGTRVIVQAPDGTRWEAIAGGQSVDPMSSDTVNVELAAPDGGPICRQACDQIGAVGQTTLLSEIVTVPVVEGLVVPASAVSTDGSERAFLTDADGTQHEISVVQSARGMALVDGVDEGLRVRVPAARGQ